MESDGYGVSGGSVSPVCKLKTSFSKHLVMTGVSVMGRKSLRLGVGDVLGIGMINADLKQGGMTTCSRDRMKMSVNTCDSCFEHLPRFSICTCSPQRVHRTEHRLTCEGGGLEAGGGVVMWLSAVCVCVCVPDTQATAQTGNEHVLQNKSIEYLMPSLYLIMF